MSSTTTAVQQVLRPQTFDQLVMFANMAAKSALVPRDYQNKPENVMLAVQMGSEIGLAPMQSLQNIAVINGRPAVWGDAMLGLCRNSATCKDVVERIEGEGEKMTATCIAHRAGSEPVVVQFSVDDAKKALLWGKAGPWQQYPKRMLQMRARSFALRDAFPDVLRGLVSAEEAQDTPAPTARPAEPPYTGQTIDGKAEQPRAEKPVAGRYRISTPNGVSTYDDAPAWLEAWGDLFSRLIAEGGTGTIIKAVDFNRKEIEAVRKFDPQSAERVEGLAIDMSSVAA
jgi:hypothetical protein